MDQIECVMELFESKVRRLANGNKLSIVFENFEDKGLEKNLIDFRGVNVNAKITQNVDPENPGDRVYIDENFEVFDIHCRRLRNGDKLQLKLECFYDKKIEHDAVSLKFNNVKIFMERLEKGLPFEDQEGPEIEDIESEG
jgi:hypothetical protein